MIDLFIDCCCFSSFSSVYDLRKYVIPVSLHLHIYIRSIIWNLVNWIAIFDLYRFIMPPTTATPTYTDTCTYIFVQFENGFTRFLCKSNYSAVLFYWCIHTIHIYNSCGTLFHIYNEKLKDMPAMPYHTYSFIIWNAARHICN